MFFLGLTLKSKGTAAKEGGNALTKVDLGMHCDKGHVAWRRMLDYQLNGITKVDPVVDQ